MVIFTVLILTTNKKLYCSTAKHVTKELLDVSRKKNLIYETVVFVNLFKMAMDNAYNHSEIRIKAKIN